MMHASGFDDDRAYGADSDRPSMACQTFVQELLGGYGLAHASRFQVQLDVSTCYTV